MSEKPTKIIYRNKDGSSTTRRNRGEYIFLKPYEHELSIILGIAPEFEPRPSFAELTGAYSLKAPRDCIPCIIEGEHSDLFVTSISCRWCPNNNMCTELERGDQQTETATFELYCSEKDADFEVLYKHLDHGNLHNPAEIEIFSWPNDPFKPGFSVGLERIISVMPLENVHLQQTPNGSTWSHLFYCPPLRRTISIFEAQIIDYLPIRSLVTKRSTERRFPHEIEVVELFEQKCNFRDEKSLRNHLKSSLSNNNDWRDIGGLIKHTQSNIQLGFYNLKTELMESLSLSSDVVENVSQFLWKLYREIIINNPTSPGQDNDRGKIPVVEERVSSIILSPQPNVSPLTWSNGSKIIRIMPVRGLVRPWVMIDGQSNSDSRVKQGWELSPVQTSTRSFDSPSMILVDSYKNYRNPIRLVKWDQKVESSRVPISIRWFPPSQIHSAMTMHSQLRSFESRYDSPNMVEAFETLDRFMNMFFLPQNPSNDSQLTKDLESFILAYREPLKRKLSPYASLVKLEKQDGGRFRQFIRIEHSHNASEQTDTESIIFPRLIIEQGDSRVAACTFSRTRSKQRKEGESKPHFVHHLEGFTDSGTRELVIQLTAALSVEYSVSESNDTHDASIGGLWISQHIYDLVLEDTDGSREICRHIAMKARGRDHKAVLFVASPGEMANIRHIVGDIEPPPVKFSGPIDMIFWNPPLAASEFSPNFVYIGRFE